MTKNMNKTRIEALSDGVFAIIMTILVLEFKIPHLPQNALENSSQLFGEILKLTPVFFSYSVTFAILAMYWIGHHNLFHLFTKNINRTLMELNVLFLMLVSLLPFMSHLLGSYRYNQGAIQLYSIAIILIGASMLGMYYYAKASHEIETHSVNKITIKKIQIRILLPVLASVLAFFAAFINVNLAFFILFVPIVFNIIPGSLNFFEKYLGKETLKVRKEEEEELLV
jgi:uncharacterized membrane protein